MAESGVTTGMYLCRGGHGWPRAALLQGCIYAATKSPGAILVNAEGVGPKGRGQDARDNAMDLQNKWTGYGQPFT
jgi:hypothetical protein